jgi:2-polyprenyl-3-methyl-5-hydroxy-6-metoxy-1,4-benzoquinol methylase
VQVETPPETALWEASSVLPGNVGKMRLLLNLERLLEAGRVLQICDVGCVGTDPFNLWAPLFELHQERFELAGLDIVGIEEARFVARERGWDIRLTFGHALSIEEAFPGERFDVVVCTGVLQALRNPAGFFHSARQVLSPSGRILLTAIAREGDVSPRVALTHFARRQAARLPSQAHRWYHGLLPGELETAAGQNGFRVREWQRCNLSAIKPLQNASPSEVRNEIMRRWYLLESGLVEAGAGVRAPGAFLELFFHLELA